jgi:hypothetical protein
MNEIYRNAGGKLLKQKIKCLFWKESLITSNLIRAKKVDLGNIFAKDDRLRFLLPIRNPLDCAISNLNTGHVNLFDGLNTESSKIEVVQAILDEIFWFAELQREYPDRFFCYFEHEISREMLIKLATFVHLEPSDAWLENALLAMKVKNSYRHDRAFVAFYRHHVNAKFAQFPALSDGLLRFVEAQENT